jgi:hypothetical protein
MKGSQLGLELFTAAVIAASKVARLIASRGSGELDTQFECESWHYPSQLNPVLGIILEKP